MPLRTETYDFDEEEQRLEDKLDELDDVLDDVDDADIRQRFENERPQLRAHLEGVRWARDEAYDAEYAPMWDADVDAVTFGGLTGGEFGALEDDVGEHGGGSGAVRVYQVAKGTVEAPYVDDSMGDDERIGTVSQLPVAYLKWARDRIDALTGVGGNGEMSFRALYEEIVENSQ
ncbi:hypothetical protein [Natronoarchaeum rubrum]|uniref:hypothetical protein n=1 Tax=Natronoarchaeum rubrum TaxID=755311 RepID=UPI002112D226|nr:hypothetical protein [Natronoarchaeum rubrum]